MLYAIIKDENGEIIADFMDYNEYHNKTFCPDSETLFIIDFKYSKKGKSYTDKKNFIREKAKAYQNNFEFIDNLNAVILLQNYFEKWGKKYGLLREFKENAII